MEVKKTVKELAKKLFNKQVGKVPGAKAAVEVAKKARGHYKQKECPYCHIHVGNLGNHIRLKHATEAPPVEISKESLLKKKSTSVMNTNEPTYYCNDCHAELRKDENPCWKCGKLLNWSAIEGKEN